MLLAVDCVPYRRFEWHGCHGWRTLHSGQRPARPHFLPLAAFCTPIRQTARLPSRVWSRPTRSRFVSETSWPSGPCEAGMLQTWRAASPSRDHASQTGVADPRALTGRLPRAQTPLRALAIEISFGREGRAGTRIIRLRAAPTSLWMGATHPRSLRPS